MMLPPVRSQALVVGVGIADVEGEIIVGIRVHLVGGDGVEALGHLTVALARLGPKLARPAAHRKGLQQGVLPVGLHLPDFEFRFLLVGADEDGRGFRRADLVHLREGLRRDRPQRAAGAVEGIFAAREPSAGARREAGREDARTPGPNLHRFRSPQIRLADRAR